MPIGIKQERHRDSGQCLVIDVVFSKKMITLPLVISESSESFMINVSERWGV